MRIALFMLALQLSLPALARAMELDDLRLAYAPLAGRDFETSGQLDDVAPVSGFSDHSQRDVGTDAKQHRRTSLAYRRSLGELQAGFGAPMWGVELAYDRISESQGVIHYDGKAQMLDLVVGWAWRVMPRWHIEQGVFAGLGHARWRQHIDGFYQDGSNWDNSASGFAYEYGLSLGSYYTFAEHYQAGLDLRHLVMRSRARFVGMQDIGGGDTESVSYDAKFDVRGFGVNLSLGYRF